MVDKKEKYRKTNLTNDRKKHKLENIHDTFIDVQIYFNLSMNFFLIVAVKAYLADENETGLGISELAECHWF